MLRRMAGLDEAGIINPPRASDVGERSLARLEPLARHDLLISTKREAPRGGMIGSFSK